MNKIEVGLKLDFNNVLIRPKRSTINTRSAVKLTRTFNFRNAHISWEGIPIIAANMDTTGTFEVYDTISRHNIITALHKFYSVDELITETRKRKMNPNLFMISTGINDDALEHLIEIFKHVDCNWICIDIANGYISKLVEFCKSVRHAYPNKIIVAGYATDPLHYEYASELIKKIIKNKQIF